MKQPAGVLRLPPYIPVKPIIKFTNNSEEDHPFPDSYLLALHRACCKILEMSGAAEYVEAIVKDSESIRELGTLAADGSTQLDAVWAVKGLLVEEIDVCG